MQNRLSTFVLFTLVGWAIVAGHAIATQPERESEIEVDTYLFGGQSNMQGIGKIANLTDDVPREIPKTFFFVDGKFEPLVVGDTQTSTRPGEFGPEVGFALEMAIDGRPIYLIKYAASGMPLDRGWHGNDWRGGIPTEPRRNFFPGESSYDETQGSLYRAMVEKYQAGLEVLDTGGYRPIVRGFVWMQGEQDSKHAESATAYAANLRRLFSRLEADMQLEARLDYGFVAVFGQVLPHEPTPPRFTHRSEIRLQMAHADAHSKHPGAIPNARMVSTDDCELLGDKVHYSAAGQLLLGRKFARMMKDLHKKE